MLGGGGGNQVICNNMGETGGGYFKWNKPEKGNTARYHICVKSFCVCVCIKSFWKKLIAREN